MSTAIRTSIGDGVAKTWNSVAAALWPGLGFDKRDGTYLPLPHPHAGYTAAGARTEEAEQTYALFQKRRGTLADFMTRDGLSNLKFELLDKRPISIDGKILP